MKIYLAGKVPKGDEEAKTFHNWRDDYKNILQRIFPDANCIEPYHLDLDESDLLLVVGSDCKHIKDSSLVVINAEEKLGVGTATELVIAKHYQKPVIAVLPKDSHHRRSNVVFHGKLVKDWIHPFIFVFSDFIVESVNEVDNIKDKVLNTEIKSISIIDESVNYFKQQRLS
jgi:hypothetical protein